VADEAVLNNVHLKIKSKNPPFKNPIVEKQREKGCETEIE
jgi:hypothetical protein